MSKNILMKLKPLFDWMPAYAGMTGVIILLTMLAACGFKLRGQAYLPPEIRTIYLKSNAPYGSFTEQLRQTLVSMGIKLVENEKDAPIVLEILNEGTQRQLTGLSTTTPVNTYQLIYTVTFKITDNAGRALGPVRSVSARRAHVVNSSEVLSVNMEYNLLEQDMRREAVYQIINQLGSRSVLSHLKLSPNPKPQ